MIAAMFILMDLDPSAELTCSGNESDALTRVTRYYQSITGRAVTGTLDVMSFYREFSRCIDRGYIACDGQKRRIQALLVIFGGIADPEGAVRCTEKLDRRTRAGMRAVRAVIAEGSETNVAVFHMRSRRRMHVDYPGEE